MTKQFGDEVIVRGAINDIRQPSFLVEASTPPILPHSPMLAYFALAVHAPIGSSELPLPMDWHTVPGAVLLLAERFEFAVGAGSKHGTASRNHRRGLSLHRKATYGAGRRDLAITPQKSRPKTAKGRHRARASGVVKKYPVSRTALRLPGRGRIVQHADRRSYGCARFSATRPFRHGLA